MILCFRLAVLLSIAVIVFLLLTNALGLTDLDPRQSAALAIISLALAALAYSADVIGRAIRSFWS